MQQFREQALRFGTEIRAETVDRRRLLRAAASLFTSKGTYTQRRDRRFGCAGSAFWIFPTSTV